MRCRGGKQINEAPRLKHRRYLRPLKEGEMIVLCNTLYRFPIPCFFTYLEIVFPSTNLLAVWIKVPSDQNSPPQNCSLKHFQINSLNIDKHFQINSLNIDKHFYKVFVHEKIIIIH